ncbi:MAG: hypothetical protein WB677_19525 [Xanthobacteraceae bacterium]
MRLVHAAVLFAVSASPALAQRGPVIVIPGRPDVPIFENGVDVSWSVIEGEFGLDRPGMVQPTVIYRMPPVVVPYPGRAALGSGYFPQDGRTPGYGRLELVPGPNRRLPPPAQSYNRSWSMESAPTPADLPSNNPNVIAPVITPYVFPGAGPPGPPGPHR